MPAGAKANDEEAIAKSPDLTAWVRRADVSLRAEYPNLVTRIFELEPYKFLIYFDRDLQEVSAVDFEQIRPVTLQACVSNALPEKFYREITPLADEELANNFSGFPFTRFDILNLLVGRFPAFGISAIKESGTPITIHLELSRKLPPQAEQELLDFCQGLGVPAPFEIVTAEGLMDAVPHVPGPVPPRDDPLQIKAFGLRRAAPSFVRADEAFWFDNLDRIYRGSFRVDDIPGVVAGESRCFVDATVGTQINLRQLLALYDAIYLSPPLLEEHENFLRDQALTDNDLFTLAEKGRFKVLATQAEERLNTRFLSAVAERSPSGIMGRRTVSAMILTDMVCTANCYRLRDPSHYSVIGEICRALGTATNTLPNEIIRFALWPVQAPRSALRPLLDRGSKGIMPVGLGPLLAREIKRRTGKDLEVETLIASERVHIAHALGATAFPAREEEQPFHALANMMGDALNFFRSFNTEIFAAWVGETERKQLGRRLLPPMPLLEFDSSVSIEEILEVTSRGSLRNSGRGLFTRLAALPDDDRTAEVERLNAELRRKGRQSGLISFETLDTGLSIAALSLGLPYPPVAGLGKFSVQIINSLRKVPQADQFFEAISADLSSEKRREIDFLSRIDRVARLKRSWVF